MTIKKVSTTKGLLFVASFLGQLQNRHWFRLYYQVRFVWDKIVDSHETLL